MGTDDESALLASADFLRQDCMRLSRQAAEAEFKRKQIETTT